MSGYHTFEDLDILTAADVNGYLMSQTVPRFASTGTRDAAITTPDTGQLCWVAGLGLLTWDGTTWSTTEKSLVGGNSWKGPNTSYLAQGIVASEVSCNQYASGITCVAGRSYVVEAQFTYTISVAAAAPVFYLKENDTAGTLIASWWPGAAISMTNAGLAQYRQLLRGPFHCTSTGTRNFMLTGKLWAATGGNLTVVRDDSSYVAVFDAGTSAGSTGSPWTAS